MSIATYRTMHGAARYGNDIQRKFPKAHARVLPWGFGFAILVTLPTGQEAWAAKRPRNYARDLVQHHANPSGLEG